jgi:hypothetical protein
MDKKFKKKPRLGRAPDPGGWDRDEMKSADGVAAAERILSKLKNAPGAAWDKSFKFFTDVEKRVAEMKDTIATRQNVSEGQEKALANWEAAIDRGIKAALPRPEES